MIETHVAAGRLLRLRQGVYLDAAAWPADPTGQHLALAHAELVAHPAAVMSHQTAALVWDLPSPTLIRWHELPITVTVPSGGGRRAWSQPSRHLTGLLPGHHVTKDPQGYGVTTVARTAVDLATRQQLPEALVLLDAAARQLVAALTVTTRRADFANPRLAKVAVEALREVATVRRIASLAPALGLADPRRETPIESLTAGHLVLAGLPLPEFQASIRSPLGMLYPDCLWRSARLVGEADGAVKYQDSSEYVREKEREQVLRDLGFRVVRWLGKEILMRPDVVMARIAHALER